MPRKTVSMEEAFQELDAILEQLEGKDISLEDSFALYQKGMELVKTCMFCFVSRYSYSSL